MLVNSLLLQHFAKNRLMRSETRETEQVEELELTFPVEA
jgi:hypothetical protein